MNRAVPPKFVTMMWNYLNWGGAQIYFLSIARNVPIGWKVKLVLPREASSEIVDLFRPHGVEVEYLNVPYTATPAPSKLAKLRRQWRRIRSEAEMYSFNRRRTPAGSVVHIEAAPWQSWILLFLLSRRFATIATVHNSLPVEIPAWRRSIWKWRLNILMRQRRFQLFAANQDAVDSLRTYIQTRYWAKISLARAAINPIEINDVLARPLEREMLLRQHGIPTDKFIVLCVGQFIDRKGRWVFLDAARKASLEKSDLFFVWVGPQSLDETELDRIRDLEVEGSFKYLLSAAVGTTRRDVLSFFRVADVFALVSYVEGLPISIIEAMSLGVPVVSTNINAIPEAVQNMITGLLVEPGDSDSLTQAVLKLRSDGALRNSISIAGRKFATSTFDERITTAIVYDRYQNGLGQNASIGSDS